MIRSCFIFSSSRNTHAVHFLALLITVYLPGTSPECQHLLRFTQWNLLIHERRGTFLYYQLERNRKTNPIWSKKKKKKIKREITNTTAIKKTERLNGKDTMNEVEKSKGLLKKTSITILYQNSELTISDSCKFLSLFIVLIYFLTCTSQICSYGGSTL